MLQTQGQGFDLSPCHFVDLSAKRREVTTRDDHALEYRPQIGRRPAAWRRWRFESVPVNDSGQDR